MVKKKIGIKYCGGCNPFYERVELIDRVKFRFDNQFYFLRHDSPDIDIFIFVNGCPRACATKDLDSLKIPYYSLTGENDFKNLINWLTLLD